MKQTGTGKYEQSHSGFWALWNVQREKLLGYCLSLMGGSEEEAKDALGGTLLKALDAWPHNHGRLDNPAGWLFRIAHNHCMDQHRDARRRLRSEGDPDELGIRNRDLHPDLPESPEETFLRREMHVNLEEAISQLPLLLRDVMILRCVRELSYPEIAGELSISEETARKRVQLGREAIRQFLEGYDQGSAGELPLNVLLPDEGEKALSDSVVIDPYKDLQLQRDHCRMILFPNKGGEVLENIAYSHLATRRMEQKIAGAEKYIDKFPTGWVKRMDLAELYYLSGQWNAAWEQAGRVLERGNLHLGATLLTTSIALQSRNRRKALETLKNALSRGSKPGIRSFLEGLVAMISRQYPIAVRALKNACVIAPTQPDFPVFLSRAYLLQGDPVRARKRLLPLIAQNTGVAPLALMHKTLIHLGDPLKAQQVIDQLLSRFPHDLPALERKIQFHLEQGWVVGEGGKETRGLIRKLLKIAPESAVPVAFKAEYQLKRGKTEKALELLHVYLDTHPNSLRGRYHLARLYTLLDKREEALMHLSAISGLQSGHYLPPTLLNKILNPDLEPATYSLDSHSDWELSNWEAWIDIFHPSTQSRGVNNGERLLEFRSGWPIAWYRKGWLDLLSGREEAAVSTWSQAWDLLPAEGGFCLKAGISLGQWLACHITRETKGKIHWEAQLKQWLPLAASENYEFHLQLSAFFNSSRKLPSLRNYPRLFFLSPLPGLWLHDWPLL